MLKDMKGNTDSCGTPAQRLKRSGGGGEALSNTELGPWTSPFRRDFEPRFPRFKTSTVSSTLHFSAKASQFPGRLKMVEFACWCVTFVYKRGVKPSSVAVPERC